ncbi:LysR family transcriptional regulator [Escherichia coli]|uniref:LysR family transcriptional regulator n=1 Tax=Enterobacterales TaxID=91347 RepID=UPI000BE83539|nr:MULTISPECIES: LysR family transcriptional regulator [Enterobacterales]ELQ6158937.1 LysR family transcriptional regulator [Cronobacter dublinensis]ELY3857992.1 LysR family transcriptional regulator [Providencia rettgeri]KAA4358353.1 LysR family transcriptional regulator [Bacteroides ovatus]EAC1376132.1 LysR family transcriptional regulator [Escherichia coli]EEY3974603.1 LysR family transcriptional regulator [Escherichia coli]
MKIDLNLLPVFIAVAEERNFTTAAARLGVTRSAISQGMRRLEDTLGTMLVMRTTRSVNLTEAGERLRTSLSLPLSSIEAAFEDIASDSTPCGLLRIAVTSIAEEFLSGPLIASFAAANPAVTIDIVVTDEEFDIVAAGYDAGVRLGDVIEKDMIAIPLTEKQREMVVASPSYLTANSAPLHPCELVHHQCIGWRPSPDVAPYRWEFEENGRAFDVAVEPRITTNDLRLMLRLALAGGGITFAPQETFKSYIENGQLVSMLDDFLPHFPGFYLYFPQRRNIAPKLRALIDHVRLWRQPHAKC